MNRARGIGAFLSLAVMTGVVKKGWAAYQAATGWRRWAILLATGCAVGVLVAIILRAFLS